MKKKRKIEKNRVLPRRTRKRGEKRVENEEKFIFPRTDK